MYLRVRPLLPLSFEAPNSARPSATMGKSGESKGKVKGGHEGMVSSARPKTNEAREEAWCGFADGCWNAGPNFDASTWSEGHDAHDAAASQPSPAAGAGKAAWKGSSKGKFARVAVDELPGEADDTSAPAQEKGAKAAFKGAPVVAAKGSKGKSGQASDAKRKKGGGDETAWKGAAKGKAGGAAKAERAQRKVRHLQARRQARCQSPPARAALLQLPQMRPTARKEKDQERQLWKAKGAMETMLHLAPKKSLPLATAQP